MIAPSATLDLQAALTAATLDLDGTISNTAGTSSLIISGTANLGGSITTTGTQTYSGAVTLSAATITLTTTNSDVTFGGTIDSDAGQTRHLTIDTNGTTGTIQFGGLVGNTVALGAIGITGNLDLDANIVGAASLAVSGSSNLGASVTTTGNQTYTGAVTLSADVTLTTTNNGDVSFSNVVDGDYDLQVSTHGTGDTTFAQAVGANTALNNITITTDEFTAAAIKADGTFSLTNLTASTISGILSETSALALTKAGVGNLTLTAVHTFTGDTTISAGDVIVGGSGQLGSGSYGGAISLASGSTLSFGSSVSQTLSGVISGDGDVEKVTSAASTLTLSGDNTYTGGTNVSAGYLQSGSSSGASPPTSGPFGTATVTVASGAVLDVNGQTVGNAINLSGTGISENGALINSHATAATISGDITLAAHTSVGGAHAVTLSGAISGTGINFTKVGASTYTLSNTNTYTGDTTISAGTLKLTGNLNSATDLVIAPSATLDLQAALTAATLDLDGTISNTAGTSSLIISGTANLGGSITTTGTQTYTGAVTLSGGDRILQGSTVNFGGTITGTGSHDLTVTGNLDLDDAMTSVVDLSVSGTSNLGADITTTGTQTYTGVVTLSDDIALTTSGADVIFNDEVVTDYSSSSLVPEVIQFLGNGGYQYSSDGGSTYSSGTANSSETTLGEGYITFASDTYTWNFSQSSTVETLLVGGGGSGGPDLGGGGGGGGVISIPSLSITANTDYEIVVGDGGISTGDTGGQGEDTTAFGATAAGGGTSGRHSTGDGTDGGSGGGAASNNNDINTGGSGQVGSSLGGHTGTIYGNDGGDNASTRAGDPTRGAGGGGAGAAAADSTTSSTSDDGQSDGGDGIQNDITGTILSWGGGGGGAAYNSGYAGDGGLGGGGGGSAQTSGRAGTGGTGGLSNGAAGTNGTNQNGGAGGANTGGGGGGGSWSDSRGGAGGSGIVVIRNTYTQTIYNNHNLTINSGAGAVDMNGNVAHIGALSINSTSLLSEISGIIDGVTALTKTGAGTLTLSGTNTYTGSTTLTAGTIRVASSANLGATPVAEDTDNIIFNGGTLTTTADFTLGTNKGITMTGDGTINTGAFTLTYGGVTTGSGNLTKTGAGTLTLSGTNTYTGDTTISAGTLTVTGTLADTTDVSVASGATYDVDQTDTIQSLSGAGTINIASTNILTFGDANDKTISGVIEGDGSVIKQGASTYTLSNINTYTGDTTISNGTLTVTGTLADTTDVSVASGATYDVDQTDTIQSLSGAGTINIASTNILTFGDANDKTIDGVIEGDGSIVKVGSSTYTLSGTNTYTGSTTLTAGTIRVASSANLGATPVAEDTDNIIFNGGTLTTTADFTLGTNKGITMTGDGTINTGAFTLTYGGVTTGSGNLTKTGAGTLTLSGTNTYTGSTTLTAGTIRVASSANLGATPVAEDTDNIIFNGGTLTTTADFTLGTNKGITMTGDGTINTGAFTLTYGGVTTGSGNLTKTGAGTLTLSGTNTYTGDTTISAGTLTVTGTLADTTDVSVASGATYDVDQTDTIQSLSGAGTINIASTNILTFGDANDKTIDGVIEGDGSIVKVGSSTYTLSGTNTYTGQTNINTGTLAVTVNDALGSNAAGTVIASGATLDLQNVNYTTTEAITNNGGTLATSTGTSAYAGVMTLGADSTVDVDGTQLTISTAIGDGSGGYAITKDGNGTLVLSATSTYTGDTTISAGTLKLTGNLNSATDLVIAPSATLDLQAALTAATLDLDGTISNTAGTSSLIISGTANLGGSITTTGTQTYNNAVTLTANTILSANTGGDIWMGGTVNGAYSLTLNTTGTNILTSAIGGTTALTSLTTNAGGATFITDAITTTGTQTYNDGVHLFAPITLTTTDSDVTFGGTIDSDEGQTRHLTIDTNGTTGTIQFGGLVGNTVALGAIGITGNLDLNAAITNATSISVSGTSNLGANVTTSGNQTYTGAVTLSGGTRALQGSTVNFVSTLAGGSNALTITGILDLDGAATGLTTLLVSDTSNLGANVTTTSTQTYQGAVTITGNRTLTTTNSNVDFDLAVNAAILGDSLTLAAGSGDVTFDNAIGGSTALGNLNITTGALTAGAIKAQGTLTVTNSDTSSITGVISEQATLALTKAGSGTLTLSGTNTFTGSTTINAGTISIGADNSLGAAPDSVDIDHLTINGGTLNTSATFSLATNRGITIGASHATIHVNAGTTLSYAGDMTGSGNFTKTGDGTLNLTGSADFSGSTTIGAGGLGLSDSLPSSTDLTINGTLNLLSSFTVNTLSGSGNVNMATYNLTVSNGSSSDDAIFSGVIDSSTGRFIKSGEGSQTLSGINTYAGTTINGGTLSVSSDANLGTSPGSTDADNIILGGGTLNTTASFTMDTDRGVTLTGNGGINVNAVTTLTYGGIVADGVSSFSLTKSGGGDFVLSGAHTYDGDTTISAGTITLTGSLNLETDMIISDGATWDLRATQTINSLNLDGTISNGAGASSLTVSTTSDIGGSITTSGTQTYTSAVTVSANVTLTTTDSNVLFGSTINGSGGDETFAISSGSGTVTFLNTIGATTAINSLTVTSTGGIYVADNITTNDSLADGLYYVLYNNNNYFADNLTFFNGTPGRSGAWPYSTINVQDGSQIIYGDNDTFNYRWSGYFTPNQTGTWNFRTTSDDSSLVYIGSAGNSVASYISTLQASSTISGKSTLVVNNAGLHGDVTKVGSISLVAGNAYPFVSYFAENGGGATMIFNYGFGNYNLSNVSSSGGYFTNDQASGGSSAGSITFNGAVTLTGSSTMTGNTQFVGTLTGGSNALTVTGNLDLDGAASNLTSTSVSGTSNLGASVTTTNTQTYTGAVILSTDTTLTSTDSDVSFGSTIDSDSIDRDLSLITGSGNISVTGAVGSSNNLDVLTVNNTGTFTTSSSVAATTMTLTHTGGTTIGGTLTATTMNLTDTTDAASITFNGNVSATTLNTAAEAYNVVFNGTTSTVANAVTFSNSGTVTFGNGTGDTTTFTGGIAATAPTQVNLAGTVVTTDTTMMSLGDTNTPIVLTANTILSANTGGDIWMGGTVNGAYSLTLNTTGTNILTSAIGGTTALTSLTTNAGGATFITDAITTTGTQTYNDGVHLFAPITLTTTDSDVTFGGTIDSDEGQTRHLTIDTNGTTGTIQFGGLVGNTVALGAIGITGNLDLNARSPMPPASVSPAPPTSVRM